MTRFTAILLALKIAAPHWGPKVETSYLLEQLERRYHVQAELIIADVEHESRWQERAVNASSGALGLMQIMPLRPGDVTARELLTWRLNLVRGVAVFALARSYCRAHGRGSLARDWLNLPTGWDAVRHARCGYRGGKRLPTPEGIEWLLHRAASLRHVGR